MIFPNFTYVKRDLLVAFCAKQEFSILQHKYSDDKAHQCIKQHIKFVRAHHNSIIS